MFAVTAVCNPPAEGVARGDDAWSTEIAEEVLLPGTAGELLALQAVSPSATRPKRNVLVEGMPPVFAQIVPFFGSRETRPVTPE